MASRDRNFTKASVPHAIKANGPLVIGRRASLEVLKKFPERVLKAYCSSRPSANKTDECLELLQSNRISIQTVDSVQLDALTNSSAHQGCVLELKARTQVNLKDFLSTQESSEQSLVLALDDIQDPHNLGAILRVAECFGVNAVLWSKNRGSGITPTVTKTSAGASELMTCIEVANLRDALLKFKDSGFWIVATAKTEDACDLKNFEWPKKAVLVLGGEGQGIGQLILRESDYKVWIPLKGSIDSLNVAQSAAVLAYSYK